MDQPLSSPGVTAPTLRRPAHRSLCTDCGVSRLKNPEACASACQFIKPDYTAMEAKVHGRSRNAAVGDERFFGPYEKMYQAALSPPADGAQWTGITTTMAQKLLESDQVDAVVAVGPDPADRWRPRPVIVTQAEDMAHCRGMRMGYAPTVAAVHSAVEKGYKRLAVIAIPCQVYALRALEADLALEKLFVIGTPCSDNTTTENFHGFLQRLDPAPETINYLEFRADYRVEIRHDNGRRRFIPFLNLPISDLPANFFPLTCRTCVDYTNALADVTVGYMAGNGQQWLICRNGRGAHLIETLGDTLILQAPVSKGDRRKAVTGFIENTRRAAGGLPVRRMPRWVRPIVNFLMPLIGPKGLEFARSRLEMKAAETVLHLARENPGKIKSMVPDHVWALVKPYGLTPETVVPATPAARDQKAARDRKNEI